MMKRKKIKIPNTIVIVFFIIVFAAIITFLIPGGEYNRETLEFRYVKGEPQTWQIFTSFYKGFTKQAGIVVFILVIGASFWVVNSCRAIDAGIYSFLSYTKSLEKNRFLQRVGVNNIIIVLIMLLFSLFGAVFGMSEETIAFTIILIPLAITMGYDSVVGVALVYVAAHVGFSGAILNPFTIGIAQNIAGLPMFSGIEYRFFLLDSSQYHYNNCGSMVCFKGEAKSSFLSFIRGRYLLEGENGATKRKQYRVPYTP